MNRQWKYFAGAAVLAAYLLLANGAPPLPVAAGLALAAVLTRRRASGRA